MGTGAIPTDGTAGSAKAVIFFVSYTKEDEKWAAWVAWVLEEAGVEVRLQAWDSPAGTNFVVWIGEQMTVAARTIAICSPAYFAAHWRTQEWTDAPGGRKPTPLRVADCTLPGMLSTVSYCDLYGIDEFTAQRRILKAVGLAKPAGPPTPSRWSGSAGGCRVGGISPSLDTASVAAKIQGSWKCSYGKLVDKVDRLPCGVSVGFTPGESSPRSLMDMSTKASTRFYRSSRKSIEAVRNCIAYISLIPTEWSAEFLA
ncbi:toll/interleukin-1 receptor domain-containing protein [Frankia tisae]|uniref:toll/interleukin-1 receptor domain-containing protein n=1 Tax=Frankia tisae TaxID=2950104 RepID=UPI0021BE8302|nr:toll/interleukin-1 receptor domain-containing protein [Frankia tisae]